MRPLNALSRISSIVSYAPVTVQAQFPGTCLGADDGWLKEEGYARVLNGGDYNYDPATQQLSAITPTYDADANTWNNFEITAIPDSTLLTAAIGAKCNQVDALFAQKLIQGATYHTVVYQIDPTSLGNINGAATAALAVVASIPGAAWPQGFAWIAKNNTSVPMTAAQFFAFAFAMAGSASALRVACRAIKDACLAASDLTTLNAIDITQNWPEV